MSNKATSYAIKGTLDFSRGIVKEYNAKTEEEKVYDLLAKLNEFDGQYITLSIKSAVELESDKVKVSKFVSDGVDDEEPEVADDDEFDDEDFYDEDED